MDEKIKNENNKTNNTDKYIELNTFVKIRGFAASGGQAKVLIRSEVIKLNGTVETRNKKKLYNGDVIEYEGKKHIIKI